MKVFINGKDISELGLTILKGTLDNLLKPAEKKALVKNENSMIDGTIALTTSRRVKERSFSMMFLLTDYSAIDLYRRCQQLDEFLTNGVYENGEATGINHIVVEDIEVCFRVVYNKMDKYSGFGEGKANISLNFTELNPTNRSM